MKYTVETDDLEEFRFQAFTESDTVTLSIERDAEYTFTRAQFMDLRRAIGYVYQELTHDD